MVLKQWILDAEDTDHEPCHPFLDLFSVRKLLLTIRPNSFSLSIVSNSMLSTSANTSTKQSKHLFSTAKLCRYLKTVELLIRVFPFRDPKRVF